MTVDLRSHALTETMWQPVCCLCGQQIRMSVEPQPYVVMPGRTATMQAHTTCYVEQRMFDRYQRIAQEAE